MAVADTDQQLAWEARKAPRAGVAAIVGALLSVFSQIYGVSIFSDVPKAGFLESLRQAAEPGAIGSRPSLRTPVLEFYDDKFAQVLGASVAQALAYLAIAWALTFLAFATSARREEFPRLAIYLPPIGAGLLAIANVGFSVTRGLSVQDFLDGPRTVDAARDVGGDAFSATAQLLGIPGSLALAFGFVIVSLNAMRAGLLTRFWGILGMIVGVLVVIPLGAQVVQPVWLLGIGVLLLGLWPGGPPPAWRTGRAEPWPSQQEVAAARRQRANARRGGGPEPPPEAEPEPEPVPAGAAHPASKKRKRKRRG